MRELILALALTAFTPATAAETTGSAPAAPQAGHSDHDVVATKDFIQSVTARSRLETEMAELALQKGGGKVQNLALLMVADNNKLAKDMAALAESVNVEIGSEPAPGRDGILKKLRGRSGAEFDREFERAITSSKKATEREFQEFVERGDHRLARVFATKYLAVVRKHLELASDVLR